MFVAIVSETKRRINRVFLEDLYASLDCQEWLDTQCLDQVEITLVVIWFQIYGFFKIFKILFLSMAEALCCQIELIW